MIDTTGKDNKMMFDRDSPFLRIGFDQQDSQRMRLDEKDIKYVTKSRPWYDSFQFEDKRAHEAMSLVKKKWGSRNAKGVFFFATLRTTRRIS